MGGSSEITDAIELQRAEALAGPFPFLYVKGGLFYELASSDATRVTAVSAERREDIELLRIDFETQREGWAPEENSVLLDPGNGWAPVEIRSVYPVDTLHSDWKAEYVALLEFGESVGGMPIATKQTATATAKNWGSEDPDSEIVHQKITTVEVLVTDDISNGEFYVSHYGLPEPNFERSWMGAWLVYFVGGVACLAVAYRLLQRRQSVA